MDIGALNLDRLRIFVAVAEQGGFSAAARRLGRAQSAITYAVQKLEEELGSSLFDRRLYRASLSDAGRALLPRAVRVLQEAAAFQAQARAIAEGLEPEVALVVDAMFPMPALVGALADFQAQFPAVRTRLYVESLGAAAQMVLDGAVDLGLVIAFASRSDDLVRRMTVDIELVAVAARGHPLAGARSETQGPLRAEEAREHMQLVLTDRSERTRGQDNGVIALRTWRLADLGAKHALLLAGLGWGGMPRHMVADDLAAGRLVELGFDQWAGSNQPPRLPIAAVHRSDRVLGPAATWLLARLSRLDDAAPHARYVVEPNTAQG